MKALRIALVGLLLGAISIFAVPARAADRSVDLSCVTFSWPDTIYRPLRGGNVSFEMSFQNNCTHDVLQAKYQLLDKFGTVLASRAETGFKRGVTTIKNEVWYDWSSRGTEPFTLKFTGLNYPSLGLSNPAPISIPFKFTERTVTATPSPTPTTSAADKAAADKAAAEADVKAAEAYKAIADAEIAKFEAELKAEQDAKAAAELKANQEAEAKATADKTLAEKIIADAKLEAARILAEAKASAALKKTTITCVKGKLTKKVTAVKPKCPSGYKVKS